MTDIFGHENSEKQRGNEPLAARMRPETLDEIVGQEHILGKGRLLRRAVESDRINSLILYGPPGCGKTSIAEVIALTTNRRFEKMSGVTANVAALRPVLRTAREIKTRSGEGTLLFIDEIHHFNKSQQDILLPYVEDGSIILIGATTHNPFFFINSPLTSRSGVFELEPLSENDVLNLLNKALQDEDRGLGLFRCEVDNDALEHLAKTSEGDARRALNALEVAVVTTAPDEDGVIRVSRSVAEDSIQKKAVLYDHDEDGHYDTVSAFIKSVRGSDPDAAVYWLAKMLVAGEDPRFIARRLIILASEDIGNADPRGLLMAVACKQAVEFVGMPEARIILSQTTLYLASAPKSNASYKAVDEAMDDVKNNRVHAVPKHLRGAGYKGAEILGHQGYKYAHDYEDSFVDQEYAPIDKYYYKPVKNGYEATISARLEHWRSLRNTQGQEGGKK